PNLRQRRIVSESLSLSGGDSVQQKVTTIVRFALTVQLIGALLLSFIFLPQFGVGKVIYYSVFHSISAFCNAAFDLIGKSIIDYQSNPVILIISAILIMASGLSFIVWEDLLNYRKTHKLSNYSKIVFTTTALLWILGTFL